jgi:hypothetical protein
MVFSKKNAGKWVASKGERVIATSKTLSTLVKKMGNRSPLLKLAQLRPRASAMLGRHATGMSRMS